MSQHSLAFPLPGLAHLPSPPAPCLHLLASASLHLFACLSPSQDHELLEGRHSVLLSIVAPHCSTVRPNIGILDTILFNQQETVKPSQPSNSWVKLRNPLNFENSHFFFHLCFQISNGSTIKVFKKIANFTSGKPI